MINSIENKIKFLETQMHQKCIGDFTQYFGAKAVPVHFKDFKEVPCILTSINGNDSQQFSMKFNVKETQRLEFFNCFEEKRWNWEHTCHAQNITVIKKPIPKITNKELAQICIDIGLPMAQFERTGGGVFIKDDSYKINIYGIGIVEMYKHHTPYWGDMKYLIQAIDALGYYVGSGIEIHHKWVKLIVDEKAN